MKKHIVGIAIFSFIVFAAAFIGGLFAFSRIEKVSVPQNLPAEKTHCDFGREINHSEVVTQAIFNLKTQRFSWRLAESKENSSIVLHFFVVDAEGVRYLDSMFAKSPIGDSELNYSNFYTQINKVEKQTNFYLMVENNAELNYEPHKVRQVKFNKEKAIPVTIDYGK